jgi:hypothetical protein
MSEPISRRDALKNLALMAGVLVASQAARHVQAADATPHVTPTYAAGQRCGTCLQFKGQATDAFGPCTLFPGKVVSSNGWCKVYVKKT